jgi:hypothetical protein
MKLNAVKFKDKKSFDKNKTKLNVREVHEPFGIIVFADEQEVKPDFTKVSLVNTIDETLEAIPTGLVICIANDFIAGETFFQTHKVVIKERRLNLQSFDHFFEQFHSSRKVFDICSCLVLFTQTKNTVSHHVL